MLSVNGRISHNATRNDTTWLEGPELNVGDAFNWQISSGGRSACWSHVRLSKEGSRENNEQKKKVLLIEGWIFKSEHRYQLVVRLKTIEYREDYLCYLSSTSSLYLVVLPESFIILLLVLVVRMYMCNVWVDHSL